MDFDPKLTVELVPVSSFCKNLRHFLSWTDWDILRKKSYRDANHRCQICGFADRLEAHETWDFKSGKQILAGIMALCPMCHHVKHWGHSQILASHGKLSMKSVEQHFMRINGCSEDEMSRYLDAVYEEWMERSMLEWELDFGNFPEIQCKVKNGNK